MKHEVLCGGFTAIQIGGATTRTIWVDHPEHFQPDTLGLYLNKGPVVCKGTRDKLGWWPKPNCAL